ncbi:MULTISPECIES: AraC family transcriptional regulator [Enterobacter]|uniref:AraC family transcriptional regulator n=1 Tax=Enterobacter kobei TaxID=208224 RepID=A0ABX9F0E4_9ENTR|nr:MULTISPECIES: helix-turn-helix transcriptional regulator [Enterobacter]CAE7592566.1 HTH-type transcriptional regulator NimR [Enterobacter cloacae]EKS6746648.1 helix-turn-helix transcriptional regulator [Enterobacter kobei]EKV5790713.1 helix-turn-helix transcriptional regulator [Enterobacter kobei]ELC0993699.1 helix-turn-helix transcriptional regulator [Enterobacter kobei]ELE6989020.1 helix-turn-helix transcriptional regulator [Enterobacter kobei]
MKPQSANTLYDPDSTASPAVARHLDFVDYAAEVPVHTHRKGQLIIARYGAVSCYAENDIWIVPPDCAVWIPGGIPHSAKATWNAHLNYLFIEPGAAALPERCCTLAISPLITELVDRLTREGVDYPPDSHAARLTRVTLDELDSMPQQKLSLPVSTDPKIRAMADALVIRPEDRSTLKDWAKRLALSERSFARLMQRETGLSFGRWRQQLHLIIALRELASGVPVQNVAATLGYESVNAFITMFRKAMGSTPAHYFAERKNSGR